MTYSLDPGSRRRATSEEDWTQCMWSRQSGQKWECTWFWPIHVAWSCPLGDRCSLTNCARTGFDYSAEAFDDDRTVKPAYVSSSVLDSDRQRTSAFMVSVTSKVSRGFYVNSFLIRTHLISRMVSIWLCRASMRGSNLKYAILGFVRKILWVCELEWEFLKQN